MPTTITKEVAGTEVRLSRYPKSKASKVELAWAAGLFVGEGHARMVKRGNWELRYPNIQIKMLDRRAVREFARILGLSFYECTYHVDPSRSAWQVSSAGGRAGQALNDLLPYLGDNDKRDQVVQAFIDSDWILNEKTGIFMAPLRTRRQGVKPSKETRKKMSESAKRRWARKEVSGR